MKLIGVYRSPYVRRVAASLNLMGMAYAHDPVAVFDDQDAVRPHNPLVRVPTLILDDGEALVESYAILDALDEMAGPDKRLIPANGPRRRTIMKHTAIAVGTMDKTVWAAYEVRFHPKEKIHQPWIEHNEDQLLGGLGYLDALAAAAGDGWLAGGERIGQADVSATIAFTFGAFARPKLGIADKFPALAKFAARCEAMDAFSSVKAG